MNPFLTLEVQGNLVLGSASPRRRELLERLGFEFEIIPCHVDESVVPWKDPETGVKLVAELKAVEALSHRPRKTIIAADTVVICRGEIMGKPADAADAARMLGALSGRAHEVITGVVIVQPPNRRIIEAETTRVFFREIADIEIERYIETGEPFDKAGAYAIQGYASLFIERVDGCYFNVVGLPVHRLFSMFRRLEDSM